MKAKNLQSPIKQIIVLNNSSSAAIFNISSIAVPQNKYLNRGTWSKGEIPCSEETKLKHFNLY